MPPFQPPAGGGRVVTSVSALGGVLTGTLPDPGSRGAVVVRHANASVACYAYRSAPRPVTFEVLDLGAIASGALS